MSDTIQLSAVDGLEQYVTEADDPAWLAPLRRRAFARFAEFGWPTTSEEEWRRTSLRAFEFDDYALPSRASLSRRSSAVDSPSGMKQAPAALIRIGEQTESWLSDASREAGILACPWGELDETRAAELENLLAEAVESADDRIQLWRYATVSHGVYVSVPAGVELEQPIMIEYLGEGDEQLASMLTVALIGERARATIVRRLASAEDDELLLLDGVIAKAGANGRLAFQTIETLGEASVLFANTSVTAAADANVTTHQSHLGADFVKARTECFLEGPGASANLYGVYFGTEEQHIDLRTVQSHQAHHTDSRAFFHGAVREEAHSIYQGMIRVDGTARGTDAYLTNKNLVLSDTARADSIPSLNINTDDVKCSHGSSTGKLDPMQLFYLLTRGYSESEARRMLVEGFFENVIVKGDPATHDELRARISDRLPE